MPRASLTTALALLALPAAAQPGSPARAFEPVVLEGRRLPTLLGADVAEVVGYRLSGGTWAPIPVQVDERDVLDIGLAYRGGDFHPPGGCNTECQQLFGTVHMVYWTDPDTWIGPDANPTFDADDELAFMARDGGDRRDAPTPDPPDVAAGSRVEVRLTAPEGGAPTYVYLFESVGAPASPAPYVRYNRVFCHKDMQTPSDDCDPIPDTVPFTEHYDVYGHGDGETFTYVGYLLGANPEDTWFDGDTYRLHFSDRWILDSLALGPDRPDLIDRMKVNPPNVCGRHERTASHGRGAFIVNRSGPVRAIRAVIGFNSAPMTQRDYVMYDRYFEERTFFRGHPVAVDRGKILYFDYSPAALGMRYTSNLDADGFVIDGHPDTPSPGVLTWEAVRG